MFLVFKVLNLKVVKRTNSDTTFKKLRNHNVYCLTITNYSHISIRKLAYVNLTLVSEEQSAAIFSKAFNGFVACVIGLPITK